MLIPRGLGQMRGGAPTGARSRASSADNIWTGVQAGSLRPFFWWPSHCPHTIFSLCAHHWCLPLLLRMPVLVD